MPFLTLALLQTSPLTGSDGIAIGGGLLVLVLVLGLVFLFVARYKRCPANKVLVISGAITGEGSAKCISGGGAFVWPVVQEYAYLSLEPMQINIPLKDALSFENIRVSVPSVFTVAIGSEPEIQQNAAMRLLGRTAESIQKDAQDIIFGQLRQVIASMKIDDINRDRDGFLHKVQHNLEPELRKIGLVLINVNIHDLRDESGYIEAIGRKAAATAVQQARGDVAEQEKFGEIRVAAADREKSVEVANAEKDREIGLSAAQRERAVQIANLEKERMVGEQAAAFQREMAVKEAEREKRISVANADAQAIAGEATSKAEIAKAEATLRVRQAEAYQLSETKKREAEASVQEAQNRAMARAALADAERVEAEKRALLEAPAKAEKARMIVDAEAKAEQVRLAAEADAKAVRLRLEAEAEGQYQILSRRAEALGMLVEKAGGPREAFALLMADHIPQIAETAAKAIQGIKIDKVVVWDSANGTGQGGVPGFVRGMATSLPPAMHLLRDIAGIELPNYLGTMMGETPAPVPAGDGATSEAPASERNGAEKQERGERKPARG